MKLYCNLIESHILHSSSSVSVQCMEHIHNNDVINVYLRNREGVFFVTPVKCNILFSCCFYLFYYFFLLMYVISKKRMLLSIKYWLGFFSFQWCSDQQLRPVYWHLVIFFSCNVVKDWDIVYKVFTTLWLVFLYFIQKYFTKRFCILWFAAKQWSFTWMSGNCIALLSVVWGASNVSTFI